MLIDNKNKVLKEVILDKLSDADEIWVSSPFISSNDLLFDILQRDIKITIICRLSHPASPEFFSKLLADLNINKRVIVYDDDTMHSKVYLFRKNNKSLSAIIGSSNFTDNGISENKELNILTTSHLIEIEKYFDYLINNSFGQLDHDTIAYYKTFYKKPEINRRFRKAKINLGLTREYQSVLDKFYVVKGILENESNTGTKLPFTYVFDCFCHYFKTQIIKDYDVKKFKSFKKSQLIKYFRIFLKDYFTKDEINMRTNKFKSCQEIRNNFNTVPEKKLKDFFLGIWSVSSGSGSGIRIQNIKKTKSKILRELLDFLVKNDLSMPQKYSVALTKRNEKGLKIDYLGKSAIGEIPGWLLPEKYPVKNEKFMYVLNYFKV